ncbi:MULTISPECIES: hypothetical protein [Aliivibrio]|jgi:hypothetical protein|uniref:Uncharacterized protein n=3 Tax=Aliivibrio TaxID=511678 RepID=A0A1B9NTX2_ALILO|nr:MULTISPECIES: hypothetical protein [Aliivibrio]AZL86723.1 hypothetical protein EIJ81_20585 [Aliivibrio salmonicida]MBB1315766.1 hypothetical protein [Aliivibrio sp. SR45-2]OCH17153.1 hypothetical protein A6E04_20080 [Aliivibrio logei]OEF11127.1 hypothetical protein A1Q5_11845 [Aliivibrio logei 5S-186]CAQ81363.1 putative exported protein [Aliivibrio salmonicida LFI1238]
MKKQVGFFSLTLLLPIELSAEEKATCLQDSYASYSREVYSSSSTCLIPLFEVNQFISQLYDITNQLESELFEESYWDKWEYSSGEEPYPLLTGYLSDSAVGFTVWQPEEYYDKKIEEFDSYTDWIESHGLQLSLAFGGEEKGNEPRFRIDYRWHEQVDDQVFMQFEIPFQ